MNIELELARGRLMGGTHVTLFLYPPPRGDYFVIYDRDNKEVHRFQSYFPMKKVIKLTTNPSAPSFTAQPLSNFEALRDYLL